MLYERIHLSPAAYNDFVSRHPQGDLLQLTGWGELKKATGWTYEYFAIGRNGKAEAAALILYRSLGPLTLAYAPRGPVADYRDEALYRAILEAMQAAAKARGAFLLKIDPDTAVNDELSMRLLTETGFEHKGWEKGMTFNAQPRFGAVVRFNETPDELFNRLSSKVRAVLRRTFRNGLFFEEAAPTMLPEFARLMKMTTERDAFSGRPESYFHELMNAYIPLRSETVDVRLFFTGVDLEERLTKIYGDIKARDRELKRLEKRRADGETLSPGQLDQMEQLHRNIEKLTEERAAFEEHVEAGRSKLYLSGGIYLQSGTTGYYLYGASSDEYRDLMAGYYLLWRMMTYAHEHGVRNFDLGGISGQDDLDPEFDEAPGLWNFKRRFEAEKVERIGEFNCVFRPVFASVYKIAMRLRSGRREG